MSALSAAWFTARLRDASPLSAAARRLAFDVPEWPGNLAGQHVDIRLSAPDGYQAVRSYSIASVGSDRSVEIAVERLDGGEVSPFLVDELEIGDTVELRGPLGGWFVWRPAQAVPVQLIAGGSGVVPFVAMRRAHRMSSSQTPMHLLYSLRTPSDALFREELMQQEEQARTTWHYTRATEQGSSDLPGRLTEDSVRQQTLPVEQRPLTYVCGPTGFVETVSRALIAIGHAPTTIRTERFGGL